MRTYRIIDGQPFVLPTIVEGTAGMLAMPRPDTPLIGVVAPIDRLFTSHDHLGDVIAWIDVPGGYTHLVPQAGFQVCIHPEDIAGGDIEPQPDWTYRATGVGTQDNPGSATLRQAWRNTAAPSVLMQRVWPAQVIGRIAEDAEPGWITTENADTKWLAVPDGWIIWDRSHRNLRVATVLQLGREFSELTGNGQTLKLA